MAVVAGYDDDAPGVASCVKERGHLPQAFCRPRQIELVAPGKLGVHSVVDHADDELSWVGDSLPHLRAELRPSADVGLVEKSRRMARAGCRNQAGMDGESSPLRCLTALGQSPAKQARA